MRFDVTARRNGTNHDIEVVMQGVAYRFSLPDDLFRELGLDSSRRLRDWAERRCEAAREEDLFAVADAAVVDVVSTKRSRSAKRMAAIASILIVVCCAICALLIRSTPGQHTDVRAAADPTPEMNAIVAMSTEDLSAWLKTPKFGTNETLAVAFLRAQTEHLDAGVCKAIMVAAKKATNGGGIERPHVREARRYLETIPPAQIAIIVARDAAAFGVSESVLLAKFEEVIGR